MLVLVALALLLLLACRYDQQTRELSHGKKNVKIDSFKKILQQEIARKEKYFTVGTFTSEFDDLVEDIDDDEEGWVHVCCVVGMCLPACVRACVRDSVVVAGCCCCCCCCCCVRGNSSSWA